MVKAILSATTSLLIAATVAHSAELAPMQGVVRDFRGGASALVYFECRPDGYRVVTTVQSDSTENPRVFRFTSLLAAGQVTEISVPHEAGATPDVVVIRRIGERLVIDDPVVGLASKGP